jgi:ribosomal protein S18 acetylase RimI-like enzyme
MLFHLREAAQADVPALAALHVQTFNETHRGGRAGGPSYELRERQWREAFSVNDGSSFCFVCVEGGGELVGFARGTPHEGGVAGFDGELNKIYVLRRCQRQGLGRVLLCSVARRFIERGVTSMLLFGDATSSSNGFYEKFGAERLYGEGGEFHGGYGWRDLSRLLVNCGSPVNAASGGAVEQRAHPAVS